MDEFEIGRLAYLVLLAAAVGGYFLAENRKSLGQNLRAGIVWGLLFLGAIAAYGLWNDIRDDVLPRQALNAGTGQIEVPRGRDGHFYLTLELNGVAVDFVVDTGASGVVLTQNDARAIGIDPESLAYTGSAMTANGAVRTASARIDRISLETIDDRNLRVWVNDGEMDMSLLGMTYLRRFERIEIAGDRLILTR